MKYWIFALFLWCGSAVAAQPLLTSDGLEPLLSNPQMRIVDIRDAQSFAGGHIKGAQNAPYNEWLGPPENFGILMCLENLSYITNDALLLQFLDRLAVFSSFGSTLLMADFFSKKGDVIAKEECVGEKGESLVYPRKYRLADDLIQLLTRRGFALKTRHAFAAQERLHAHYALFELRYERQ